MPLRNPSSNTATRLQWRPKRQPPLIGSTQSSLEKDRAVGHLGIPYVKAGKRIIYRIADLDAWLTANSTTPSKGGTCHE